MARRGVIPGLIGAIIGGTATVYLSYTELKAPQNWMDWSALVAAGLTTGTILFFIVWGHFQKEAGEEQTGMTEYLECPVCDGEGQEYRPIWTIVGSIIFFPIGLVLLYYTRFRCTKCQHDYRPTMRPKPTART